MLTLQQLLLLAFVALACRLSGGVPEFVGESMLPSGRAQVFGVATGVYADIILLDNGADQGLRTGAIAEVVRGGEVIADLILVDVRVDRAAALLLELKTTSPITFGDRVRLKPL